MEQHNTLILDGHTVHYRDEGRHHTQTIVLLHGFMQNMDVWAPYVLSYMSRMRVVTVDLPGHGLTANFGSVHSMELMADVVKAVLDRTGVEQCVVAGHSMGGFAALAFAERYPHMTRGLVLVNSHAMSDTPDILARREAVCVEAAERRQSYILNYVPTLFDDKRRVVLEREIKELNDMCLDTQAEAIAAAQRGMAQRPSRVGLLQQIDVPVCFVLGKNDLRLPIELGLAQTLLPRRSECMILGDVGHMAFIEAMGYVRPRLLAFAEACW